MCQLRVNCAAGDLAHGKSSLTSLVADTLSGFGAVYVDFNMDDNSIASADATAWTLASSTLNVVLDSKYKGKTAFYPILVEECRCATS